MKRTLLIEREIEAGENHCHACKYKFGSDCVIWVTRTEGLRLPACLEAERRAMEVKR